MSFTFGKLFISTDSSKRIDAANIGSEAFLLPEILTVPLTLEGPFITNLSIIKL